MSRDFRAVNGYAGDMPNWAGHVVKRIRDVKHVPITGFSREEFERIAMRNRLKEVKK